MGKHIGLPATSSHALSRLSVPPSCHSNAPFMYSRLAFTAMNKLVTSPGVQFFPLSCFSGSSKSWFDSLSTSCLSKSITVRFLPADFRVTCKLHVYNSYQCLQKLQWYSTYKYKNTYQTSIATFYIYINWIQRCMVGGQNSISYLHWLYISRLIYKL